MMQQVQVHPKDTLEARLDVSRTEPAKKPEETRCDGFMMWSSNGFMMWSSNGFMMW